MRVYPYKTAGYAPRVSKITQSAGAGTEKRHIVDPAQIDLRLAPEPESVSEARHSLNGLRDTLPADLLGTVTLLVSELVTNAVRHGGLGPEQRIGFKVLTPTGFVRVEVHDCGPEFDIPSGGPPDPEQVGGRGLYLVRALSDRWGVEPDDLVMVWFEIDRDG